MVSLSSLIKDRLETLMHPVPEHSQAGRAMKNLFSNIPNQLAGELIETLLGAGEIRIERIVSHGHASPDGFWYDQAQDEFVMLLKGAARLQFPNETVEMTPGSFIDIPAHRRHRVEWTTPNEPTVWVAVHYERSKNRKNE